MRIKLVSDTQINSHSRRLSYSQKQIVQQMNDGLLAEGTIRPSNSPYALPIVFVKKKNGETWMCIDYRNLNNSLYLCLCLEMLE